MINNKTVKSIMEKYTSNFLLQIKNEKKRKRTEKELPHSDFPVFKLGNPEFFEYLFFQKLIDGYLREYLITPALCELLCKKGYSTSILEENCKYGLKDFNKTLKNRLLPVDFVIEDHERIGIRYSCLSQKEAKDIIKEYKLNHIEILDFENTNFRYSEKNASIQRKETKLCFHRFLKSFFKVYLNEETYEIFFNEISNAVEIANAIIGFDSIHTLSPAFLCDFKIDTLTNISKMSLCDLKFQKTQEVQEDNNYAFTQKDYQVLKERFIDKKLFLSLNGNEDFAKCFITSEYLFNVFKKGNAVFFDYSAVATGYFKCIELLLQKIIELALNCHGHDELWIKCSKEPKNKSDINYQKKNKLVKFTYENRECFATEMGNLINFLSHRTNGWYLSKDGIKKTCKVLSDYKTFCRNSHFHKDIINDIKTIESIRNNTIICIYCLIGGCKLTDTPIKDGEYIGVTDNSFDRLFRKINNLPYSVKHCIFQFDENVKYKVIPLLDQESPTYSQYGNNNSRISFAVHTFDENVPFDGKKIYLSRNNMPEKMWIETFDDEIIQIEW
ncbi:MAG: hypothetical protein IKE65_08260 [Clostridia bacterium]|nr:hypothetical protein [Clostridia bacterium]